MTDAPSPENSKSVLTRGELKLLHVVAVPGLVGLLIVSAKRLGYWPGPEVTIVTVGPHSELIDLNRAEWWRLDTLPGIGRTRAMAIVETRRARKGFRSLDELTQVHGISRQLAGQLKPLLRLGTYREESGVSKANPVQP